MARTKINRSLEFLNYEITTDPDFDQGLPPIPSALKRQLENLYYESQDKKNKTIIPKLERLIQEYPEQAILKNYLMTAYNIRGNHGKAMEINREILEQHPNYLLGKINEANRLIEAGEAEKVPALLGGNLELSSIYPERNVFHLSEVTACYFLAVRYYLEVNDIEQADMRLSILRKIAPDHPNTAKAELMMYETTFALLGEKLVKMKEGAITPEVKPTELPEQTTERPEFNHPEIENLYTYGFNIPAHLLEEILDLPRQTFIQDLETVLQDCFNRYEHFKKEDLPLENTTFALHAFFLLSEIKAENSLPKVLNFLKSDFEFLNFWLGDFIGVTLWENIYNLGDRQLEQLQEFLVLPGVVESVKNAVCQAVSQVALHQLTRKQEVYNVFETVFNRFVHAREDENLTDTGFLGVAVSCAIDCRFAGLLPLIKALYEKGHVSKFITGEYEDVEKDMHEPESGFELQEIHSIYQLYEGESAENEDFELDDFDDADVLSDDYSGSYKSPFSFLAPPAQGTVKREEPKIGRNDPCSCGSGKKYKKCCG